MHGKLNFWVAGGDMRQAKLAQALAEDGHSVGTFALEQAGEFTAERAETLVQAARAQCVILPLPVEGQEGVLNAPFSPQPHRLEELLDALEPGQVVCGGQIPPRVEELARTKGLILRDYFRREELVIANTVPTAEGAVQLAMEELPVTVQGARVLVLGYGRVGQAVALRFAALGARVSVAARKYADLARAEAMGCATERIGELAGWLCGYDLIVNTVPARLLGRAELGELKSGCVVLDLASKPGGVDLEAAGALGVRVIWALSLPGKVAPVSAGLYIRDTVYNILRELGV